MNSRAGQYRGRSRGRYWQWHLIGLSLIACWGVTLIAPVPVIAQAAAQAEIQKMAELKQTANRWIEVNVATQRLVAWEGATPVYAIIVSTGTDDHPTLPGSFAVQTKHRTARMQGDDYDVPDVPYTMYYSGGYAIHGAYWHRRFGTPVSHGCVNVAVDHAKWLYDWAAVGTPVVVHF